MKFLTQLKSAVERKQRYRSLPDFAKREIKRDRAGELGPDLGLDASCQALMKWMSRAQDRSVTSDGGVARVYHVIHGWSASYPETTGYIIPTFIEYAKRTGDAEYRQRAYRMLNWLKSIQFPEGGFQGGKVDSVPVVPVVFNTGQILIGLAAGQKEFGEFGEAMNKAAAWLVGCQDPDGCWRKNESPFAASGEKVYDTHTAWGLFEAARLEPNRNYAQAALANVNWALSHQKPNGWFETCCLTDPKEPLTHTLGYALRGVIEAYRFTGEKRYLEAAQVSAQGLLGALRADGSLPGKLRSDWSSAADWVCLTGLAQIAICWLMLYQDTGKEDYKSAALRANRFVRRTIRLDVPDDIAGGIKGSYPLDGDYSAMEYPNWAAKFLVDGLCLEKDVEGAASKS
jgi:Squalene-hopene cyclase C-terminal domain